MTQTIQQALSQAQFYSDHEDYVLVRLPASAVTAAAGILAEIGEPFGAVLLDKDEVSLLIAKSDFEEFKRRLPDCQVSDNRFRLITIDVELEFNLVGFIAHLSAALAAANISILTYAAYSRDHLLVPAEHFENALRILAQLKSSASG